MTTAPSGDYDRDLRSALLDANALIDPAARAAVERLIAHNEGPEAMLVLAELLADHGGAVPSQLRERIKSLGSHEDPWPDGF